MSELPIEIPTDSGENSRFNSAIAIIVAISASMITIFNIKDNNIVQAMSQVQAHSIDAWAYYQSKGTKQHLAENARNMLEVQKELQEKLSPAKLEKINHLIANTEVLIAKYEKEKAEIKEKAEGYQKEYDELNIHDDQFDMAEAFLSLAMTVLGITALTRKRALFFFGIAMSLFGIVLGLAGFLGWNLHPDFIARLLG
jgi:DNA repair ATPase RecN